MTDDTNSILSPYAKLQCGDWTATAQILGTANKNNRFLFFAVIPDMLCLQTRIPIFIVMTDWKYGITKKHIPG
ncbi:MAG: hypothetical protein LBR69_07390 [Endomicrobium sp.]|jgi:hypothetical protein|nr:hypothetical protein [Endomicrobium sp.]